jgi:hypothetical protein
MKQYIVLHDEILKTYEVHRYNLFFKLVGVTSWTLVCKDSTIEGVKKLAKHIVFYKKILREQFTMEDSNG